MARKQTDAAPPVDDLGYEAAMEELEAIVATIESGEMTLEAAMAGHSRGRALVQRCRSILDAAEQELEEAAVEDLAEAGEEDDA